jgi:hypothetical protein
MTVTNASPSTEKRRQRLSWAAALTVLATAWAALQGNEEPSRSPSSQAGGANSARTSTNNARAEASNSASKPAPQTTAWPEAPLPDNRAPWSAVSALGAAAWRGPIQPPTVVRVPSAPKAVAAKTDIEAATPQAPNFPYTLIGRIDDGVPQAMLSGPHRSFGVKVNEVIDGQWRVDAVEPQSMSLTWLPGSLKKTVAFSSS